MTTDVLNVKLTHNLKAYDLQVPAESDFMNFKIAVQVATGVPVADQKLLFRGKVMNDRDKLFAVGLRDGSKIMLIESELRRKASVTSQYAAPTPIIGFPKSTSQEKVSKATSSSPSSSPVRRAETAMLAKIADARGVGDKLERELVVVEQQVAQNKGIAVAERKEVVLIQELCERELLKLDSLSGDGIREHRKAQVQRINALCERAEALKNMQ
mmetsp:Transcript_29004/g.48676  ORF Transcript_29004/g.48676 Transcript_29004/m.48676 type:complete len:213 (-) Transcript_29004:89-727(-)|eukprot:CAMPEP_0198228616 /NCGR_PEP_ID=MMETSP1445-20131203/113680_1 /TAXON_ID=36898 /ORGANISM="Pyramimonas sp., Strain CCMP2087" /LENGTH=212 /DNA_ID=CAMNT_0043909025 /DNA_START=376 /DNA_END=1014 /DNA_ORIENTATION=-